MIRSRVTLAITDAAEMQAATRSPFHIARPGTSSPSTGNPSVSTYAGRRSSRASERRSAATLATCMPRRSHSSCETTTTDQATARRTTCVVAALTGLGGQQLGVGQPGHDARLALGKDRRRGDQRAGTGPAARLVDAGHRREPRRGAAHVRSRRGRRRAVRSIRGAVRSSEQQGHFASGMSSNVAGRWMNSARLHGQISANTLPTTRSWSTKPPPGPPMWPRES